MFIAKVFFGSLLLSIVRVYFRLGRSRATERVYDAAGAVTAIGNMHTTFDQSLLQIEMFFHSRTVCNRDAYISCYWRKDFFFTLAGISFECWPKVNNCGGVRTESLAERGLQMVVKT